MDDGTEALSFYMWFFKNSSEEKKRKVTNSFAKLLVDTYKKEKERGKEKGGFYFYANSFVKQFPQFDYNVFTKYMLEMKDIESLTLFIEQILEMYSYFYGDVILNEVKKIENLNEIFRIYLKNIDCYEDQNYKEFLFAIMKELKINHLVEVQKVKVNSLTKNIVRKQNS